MSSINQNARVIEQDLLWLKAIIDQRIKNLPNRDIPQQPVELNPPALDLNQAGVFYAGFLQKYGVTPEERLVVVWPWRRRFNRNRAYTQVGGVSQSGFNGFIHTWKILLPNCFYPFP